MFDKVFGQKIFEMTRQIELDDIAKNGKNNLFGKKINLSKKAKK